MTPSLRSKVTSGTATVNFKEGSDLTEKERKYCSCVLKVAAKQPGECYEPEKWQRKVGGVKCYNPYPICTKSVGRKGRVNCGSNYDFEAMDDTYLKAYADLNKIEIPSPYNREATQAAIIRYKDEKYGPEQ